MALREPIRTTISVRLEELLGTEEAAALMQQFPTYELTDLVTAGVLDLRLRGTEERLRGEMHIMKADLRAEIAEARNELKFEIADLGTEMRTEMADVRTEMGELRSEMRTELGKVNTRIDALPDVVIRQLLYWLVPLMFTAVAASVALVKLVN